MNSDAHAAWPAKHPSRRDLLRAAAAGCTSLLWPQGAVSAEHREVADRDQADRDNIQPADAAAPRRIVFASQGRVGLIDERGHGERYFAPDVPRQVSWHHGPAFADGRHMILMSVEGTRTWEHNVRSHLWKYDLDKDELTELATQEPPATYMPACALLDGDQRLLVNPIIDGQQRVMTINLDGSDPVEVTRKDDGFTYGVCVSPDGQRLAFHATGSGGYRVFTTRLDGSDRRLVAGAEGHLYFGPSWSHDGEWLLYVDCHLSGGPGHDWADLCLGRPDGSQHRVITQGQRHWFGTSYGGPKTRGSGSNIPQWSPRALVCTYTRALPDSRTAWQYVDDRPDTDHFNRDYRPELARGGTEILLVHPLSGELTRLTQVEPPVWDFRTAWSRDATRLAFCRAPVGEASELWVMDADGQRAIPLTRGYDNMGADHPAWLA